MFIENGISGFTSFFELAIVPIKISLRGAPACPTQCGARKIALMEEAGGVSVEKLLVCGEPSAVRSKAIEMIQARRKLVLEGFPLGEIAAWCCKHIYRWPFHSDSPPDNSFPL